MSFLYRPTPVVNWDNGPFASSRVMNGYTGGIMRGIPAGSSALGKAAPTGAVSRMRRVNTRMQPWIQASGSMGSFMPAGMGGLGDDGTIDTTGIDWSSYDSSAPILPTPVIDTSIVAPDIGLPNFNVYAPASIPISAPPAPSLPSSYFAPSRPVIPVAQSSVPGPAPALQQAGPTGTGIPGTQPLSPVAPTVNALTSFLNSVKSVFTPVPTAATKSSLTQLPGYGGIANTSPTASWFSQSSVIPGVPNVAVIGIAILGIALAAGGGKKGR